MLSPLEVCNKLFKTPLLILGDGDFSFSKRIVMYGNKDIITSNIMVEKVRGPQKYLVRKGINIMSLDATKLMDAPHQGRTTVWCFPYPLNKQDPKILLSQFFQLAHNEGITSIILGLKSLPDEPSHQYNYWSLKDCHSGYCVIDRIQSPIFWNVTDVKGKNLPQSSGLVEFVVFKTIYT